MMFRKSGKAMQRIPSFARAYTRTKCVWNWHGYAYKSLNTECAVFFLLQRRRLLTIAKKKQYATNLRVLILPSPIRSFSFFRIESHWKPRIRSSPLCVESLSIIISAFSFYWAHCAALKRPSKSLIDILSIFKENRSNHSFETHDDGPATAAAFPKSTCKYTGK